VPVGSFLRPRSMTMQPSSATEPAISGHCPIPGLIITAPAMRAQARYASPKRSPLFCATPRPTPTDHNWTMTTRPNWTPFTDSSPNVRRRSPSPQIR
jgi:hypothetical protein